MKNRDSSEMVRNLDGFEISGISEVFSLEEFIPKSANENLWEAYFNLSETVFREFNQRGRLPNREALRMRLSASNPLYTVKRWILLDAAKTALGLATISYDTELSPDYETGSRTCQMQMTVAPAYRRRKIATGLLHHLIKIAGELEKDVVRADADNITGVEFCRYFKGELIHKEVEHQLYVEDVSWQMIDEWLLKGKTRFPDTIVESFEECPDDKIDEFCSVYTEIINQRPVGDIQEELVTTPESRRIEERNFKKREIEWHTMISREKDGYISAMTDIMYNPQEPYKIHQYFTGVLSKYRRRGLAKRLKAEMLKYISQKFPEAEYVTTTTAIENKPMRAINKQLGFVPKKTCNMYRWMLQDLERRANRVLSANRRGGTKKKKH